jgi:hypothetical protein
MPTAPKVYYEAEDPAPDFITEALPEVEEPHPEYGEVFSQDEETAPVIVVATPAATFAYAVGHRVQPAPEAPAREVIWRGQLRERRPETGLIHRTNVYRLNDGFWDCYREDELRAA